MRVCLLIVGVLLAGCSSGSKMPKTYPVAGKVLFKNGKELTGGTIRFQPATATDLTITGTIKPDGTFTLTTFAPTGKADGAPEGDYTVSVTPLLGEDRTIATLLVTKPTVSVKADQTNQFQIEVVQAR